MYCSEIRHHCHVAKRLTAFFVYAVVALLIVGCASEPSRYKLKNDKAPTGTFDFSDVPDATPKWEPISPGGNKSPYTVRGKTYRILDSAEGYSEQGIASWYGLKFHGELTSNGETYNMYEMSAAHKSLPIPSYVRVTNLDNDASVIVRVNDRGPFHTGRIIDLSFAAANRLGFADKGTAKVLVEAITVDPPSSPSNVTINEPSHAAKKAPVSDVSTDKLAPFVQIAALSNLDSAQELKSKVLDRYGRQDVFIASAQKSGKTIYRVRVGPFKSAESAKAFRERLEANQTGSPIVISRSLLGKGY